jgi:hypothetical protein
MRFSVGSPPHFKWFSEPLNSCYESGKFISLPQLQPCELAFFACPRLTLSNLREAFTFYQRMHLAVAFGWLFRTLVALTEFPAGKNAKSGWGY